MKFVPVALFAAGLAAAQSTDDLTECARNCLVGFTSGSSIAGCGRFDVECICANDEFIDGIACCLAADCTESDQEAAVQYAAEICGAQGVEVPTAVTCASLAASTTSSSATDSTETTGSSTTDASASQTTDAEDTESSSDADSAANTTSDENVGPTAAPDGVGIVAAGILGVVALL